MVMLDGLPANDVEEPDLFERAGVGETVALDWEPNRLYTARDSDVSNTEMEAISKEDQRVRTVEKIDWEIVNKHRSREETHVGGVGWRERQTIGERWLSTKT